MCISSCLPIRCRHNERDLHFASNEGEEIGKRLESSGVIIIDVHHYSTTINTDASQLIPSCSESQVNSILE